MKVIFDFSKQQIAIEGDGPELVDVLKLARDVAPKMPQISILTAGNNGGKDALTDPPKPPSGNGSMSKREWARRLNLISNVEKLTALGYYATKIEGKDSFSPKEMADGFGHCGFQKPSQMAVTVFDARKKYGYLETVGHGLCRLTTSGENLIIGKLEEKTD
jgi:hypothetical protein